MFGPKSRYAQLETYEVTDRKGRQVKAVPTPAARQEESRGTHLLRQGQRLDHLAAKYLDNPAGSWRICALNGVMLPEALSEVREIEIPEKVR